MMQLLLKLFVKNHENTEDKRVRAAYGRLSGVCGVILNVLLSIFKFTVGILSGSAAIISDAANNVSDAASSVVNLAGFKLASKPADEEHPFGHGRYEYVLSLVIALLVMLMGAELLKSAVTKILHPTAVNFSPFTLAVLIVSILIKLWMGVFNLRLSRKASIGALKAVSVDSFSDVVSTTAVLVSLLLGHFFSIRIDGYIGAAVALLVIWSGVGVLREALSPLLGKPADKEKVKALETFIVEFDPSFLGVHDLILHDYGMGTIFAVAHVEVPADQTLVAVHAKADALEQAVKERFDMQLVLHIDPVDLNDVKRRELLGQVATIVKSVDEHYTIHDFRVSEDGAQMAFDLVIDSDIEKTPEAIAEEVNLRIRATLGETPRALIHVEFPFAQHS